MKITRADIIIILLLFILTMFSFNVDSYVNTAARDAYVYIEGKLTHKIDLATDMEYAIAVPNGTATIKVDAGELYITDVPCPRRICIDDSPISEAGESLICVPNKMVVKIDGEDETLDTITR